VSPVAMVSRREMPPAQRENFSNRIRVVFFMVLIE